MRSRVALTAVHRSSRRSMTRMKPSPDAAALWERGARRYRTFPLSVCRGDKGGGRVPPQMSRLHVPAFGGDGRIVIESHDLCCFNGAHSKAFIFLTLKWQLLL